MICHSTPSEFGALTATRIKGPPYCQKTTRCARRDGDAIESGRQYSDEYHPSSRHSVVTRCRPIITSTVVTVSLCTRCPCPRQHHMGTTIPPMSLSATGDCRSIACRRFSLVSLCLVCRFMYTLLASLTAVSGFWPESTLVCQDGGFPLPPKYIQSSGIRLCSCPGRHRHLLVQTTLETDSSICGSDCPDLRQLGFAPDSPAES